MKSLSIMLKPASSLCNMRCKYCFYEDISCLREVHSYGIMTEAATEAILENIRRDLAPGDRVQFAFQGGEPTLAGLPYFQHFSSVVSQWDHRIQVTYSLQTNGLLLDDAWCIFLAQHNFLVGLSLDLLPQSHDNSRIDAERRGTYRRVLAAMELLKKHRVEFNILCTLTSEIARHPQQVWKQILALDLQYVQFTPCLDEYKLGNLAESPLREIVTSPLNHDFAQRPHAQPALCGSCPFRQFCGGNCKRMQREICCSGKDNYCGYQDFLYQNMADLQQIARSLQQNRK